VSLAGNFVTDVSPLAQMPNLARINLVNNRVSDIRPLVDGVGLSSGDIVDLKGNPLSAESVGTYVLELEERGVTVYRQ
jgi:Leucine-rich repeat (LRR) protein